MMGSDVGIKSRLSFLSCPKSFYLKEVSLKNNPKSPNIWATNKLGNQDLTIGLIWSYCNKLSRSFNHKTFIFSLFVMKYAQRV